MDKAEQWPGFKVPPNDPVRDVLKAEPQPKREEITDFSEQDDDTEEDSTCENCGGTGGEPYDDYCTPCEECDGMGYKWWL